jgi:hypothetical protein
MKYLFLYIKYREFYHILFKNDNASYEYLLIVYFVHKQTFHRVVLKWTISANKPTDYVIVSLQQVC